MATDAQR